MFQLTAGDKVQLTVNTGAVVEGLVTGTRNGTVKLFTGSTTRWIDLTDITSIEF